MIRHVALFTFTPDARPAQVHALMDGLAALPGQIADIRDYRFGPDAGLRPGTADFAVVANFDDVDAFRRYVDHPAHQELITTLLQPIAAERRSVQFAI
jgi:hypothetical protein